MSNARHRLAFAGEPPGFPAPPPLVRFAEKALRAFPTPLPAHGPEAGQ